VKIASKYFRALLVSLSDITDIVSARIYEEVLPKGYTLPAVTYWLNGGGWTGPGLQERGVTVRCWATQRGDAHDLFEATRGELLDADEEDGFKQHTATVGGVSSPVLVWQDGSEIVLTDSDTEEHVVQAEYRVAMEL